jgi:transposase InsO family protein
MAVTERPQPVLAHPARLKSEGQKHGLIFREMAMAKKIGRPVRFTPDILLRVRQMAAEGRSSIEIAKSMGSTPASVKNVCCRHKIKIPRRRLPMRSALSKLVARLPQSLSTEFHRKAERLQISASMLASRLLEAIVVSNIYEAILDDKD